MQKKEFKRHLKIRYDRIIKCLIFLLFFVFAVMYILNVRVKNIENGKKINKKYNVPIVVNYIPDTILEKFRKALAKVDDDNLPKISEIKYDPNIDDERFLLTMTDGNYVYINIKKFELINNYLTIISNFKDKKGILYLDSGSHFEVLQKS